MAEYTLFRPVPFTGGRTSKEKAVLLPPLLISSITAIGLRLG